MRVSAGVSVSFAVVALASCATGGDEGLEGVPQSWEEFRASAYREPGTGLYIVDGDTPIESEDALLQFYRSNVGAWRAAARGEPLAEVQAKLAINRVSSSDDRWGFSRARDITYCVSSAFGANYGVVVNAMELAAGDWAAQANVFFRHLSYLDGSCNAATSGVVFDVNPITGTSYIARAFFPGYARANRNVLINTAYVPNGSGVWSLRGVLRHELGHTLGFRHEHTRPEAGTCFEDNNWRALTSYDSSSVMHYPQCRGTQTGDLVITAQDATGARVIYGPRPARGTDVVDYLQRYGDLLAAFGADGYAAAGSHWLSSGVAEGRRGAAEFDAAYYLNAYGDLRAAFGATNYVAARNHWLNSGISEGRRAAREFDAAFYLAYHADVRAAYGATNYAGALDHWLTRGINEGRRSAADFDVAAYLARYPDLRDVYGATNYPAAFFHWLTTGRSEGRNPAP